MQQEAKTETIHPLITRIKSEFDQRKMRNRRYSLRTFAGDLNVSPGFLSKLLNHKVVLSYQQAARFAAALNLPKTEAKRWVESAILNAPPKAKVSQKLRHETVTKMRSRAAEVGEINILEVERFQTISKWYHLTILEMTYLDCFKSDPQWIAKQLGISLYEAKDAIARLIELGLLEACELKGLKKSSSRLFVRCRSEPEVRKFQHQMIDKALVTLTTATAKEMESGLINSITFPICDQSIPIVREAILAFQRRILRLIKTKNYNRLYQFNCQLFPLIQSKKDVS